MELNETENLAGGKSLMAGESSPLLAGENLPPLMRNFMKLPKGRQIGFIVALALTLAVAVAVLLWSQQPDYQRLFDNVPEKEAGEIVEILKKLNADYQLDAASGAIKVPADKVYELRLKLASQGLPKEGGQGFEMMDKESSFGSSQLVETVRYQRALEGEIARSIMTIKGIKSARVHLAMPKESVFVRQPKKPSASVMVDLQPGFDLDPAQVEAVVHLVASSVPLLEPEQVTVVDQRGHHLNVKEEGDSLKLSSKQFDYKKQVENHLIERVENILSPVLGRDGMRTQAAADIDFTVTERTQELYNPDLPALRSEQTKEEQNRQNGAPMGVPGALSNQPPPAGVAPELAGGAQKPPAGQAAQAGAAPQEPSSASKSATRNYELDKTVSHTRLGSSEVRRLTVAVVVDNQRIAQADGSFSTQPYSDEDLSRFASLVKEAVGYDAARGDRVTVTNAAFRVEEAAPVPRPWEQPWFMSMLKQVIAAIAIILLVFGVLRPAVKGLSGRDEARNAQSGGADAVKEAVMDDGYDGAMLQTDAQGETMALNGPDELLMLESPLNYEKRLEFAQKAIDDDPKRVAQVVKSWMNGHG